MFRKCQKIVDLVLTYDIVLQYNLCKLKGADKMAEKKEVIQVRVSPDEKKTIQKLADEAHLSMSSYVRSQLLSANVNKS